MRRRTTLVLVTALCAGGAACLLPALPGGGAPQAAAQDKAPVDLAAEWDKQWTTAHTTAFKAFEGLYKFCVDKEIEGTGLLVRRRALKYSPEDQELRKFFGYVKNPDGTYHMDEDRREKVREIVDIDDMKATKFMANQATAEKKVRDAFRALAQKARKNGTEFEKDKAAEWKERERRAWEKVLEVDWQNEEAHRALGHTKFDGRYYSPYAMEFMKVRKERKAQGTARGGADFSNFAPVAPDGLFVAAGMQGAACKSDHFHIISQHGPEVAKRICQWGERALEDFVQVYKTGPEFKGLFSLRESIVKEKGDLEKLLKAAGWDEKQIKKYTDHFSGMTAGNEEVSRSTGGAEADDLIMHFSAHKATYILAQVAAGEIGGGGGGPEDWLKEAMAYDVTRRLAGSNTTSCGAFGNYGNAVSPHVNSDIWMELARQNVDLDDDVALSAIWKKKMQEQQIKAPDIVKGYAFVQFVFEKDAEKARDFIRRSLVQGTPKAVEDVYQVSMDELDAEYRNWVLKTW